MADVVPKASGASKIAKFVFRGFVIFHLLAIFSWSLPGSPSYLKIGLARRSEAEALRSFSAYGLFWNDLYIKPRFFEDYLRVTGFQQNWNMFAPQPIREDIWVDAVIKFGNGEVRTYVFPRNIHLSLWQQILQERFKKYLDTAQEETSGIVWPSMADFVARQVYRNDGNVPVYVELFRNTRPASMPGEPPPPAYERFKFFETPILAERIVPIPA